MTFGVNELRLILVALELWDVVINGCVKDETRGNKLRELKKKDAKAIFL